MAVTPDPIAFSAHPHVLVVEADPHVRALAADIFEEGGFEVIEASTVDYAAAVLQVRNNISVVFTEAMTPGGLNGFDLARMARSIYPRIAVIVVASELPSGFTGVAPDVRFMPKPYRITEVMRLIQDVAAGQR